MLVKSGSWEWEQPNVWDVRLRDAGFLNFCMLIRISESIEQQQTLLQAAAVF